MSEGRQGQTTNLMEGFPMNQNLFGFFIIRRRNTTHSCLGCQNDCRTCIFKGFGDRFKMAAVRRYELNDEAEILIFLT
jgi:hypothetical protein